MILLGLIFSFTGLFGYYMIYWSYAKV